MSIRRSRLPFENGDQFTKIPNDWIRDRRLSRKARTILAEILSHRIGWEVTTESLVAAGREGRDSVLAGIKELKELGYLTPIQKRDGGRFKGIDYELSMPHEAPEKASRKASTATGKSGHGAPVDNPTTVTGFSGAGIADYPDTANPTLKKTNFKEDQEELITSSLPGYVSGDPARAVTIRPESSAEREPARPGFIARMRATTSRTKKLDRDELTRQVKPWFAEIARDFPGWIDVLDDIATDILRRGRGSVITDETAYVKTAIENDLELFRAAMWSRIGVHHADR